MKTLLLYFGGAGFLPETNRSKVHDQDVGSYTVALCRFLAFAYALFEYHYLRRKF
ncbi:MAG TPA: hypothetical protein VLV32_12085 [Burkholderiales bacterium]|nr:hypothetical protein [Burkholderiales bacterium]